MAYSKTEIESMFKRILRGVESGKSLRAMLRQDNMPSNEVFYKWIDKDEDKAKQYACAKEERALHMFEDMLDISDDTGEDEIELSDGRRVTNHHKINRDKLRVDTRKWALAKMLPKLYSDKHLVDVTSGGEKIDMPMISFKKQADKDE